MLSTSGADFEVLVATSQTREAWSNIQRWYIKSKGHPISPTREVLDHISTLREDLYRRRPPFNKVIPIPVQPYMIADRTPEGGDITVAVQVLRTGREGGPLGMRAYYLKVWIRDAVQEKEPEKIRCDKLVSVTNMVFREGHIPMSLVWTKMVIITKYRGDYRGIFLVEEIWNICMFIMNIRLQAAITLHDALHSFRQGRLSVTASMEAKLS